MSDNYTVDQKVIDYCYESVQLFIKAKRNLFDKDTTLRKMTKEYIKKLLVAYHGYLKKNRVINIEFVFMEALIIFIEEKGKQGNNIKADKDYFFVTFRNTVYDYAQKWGIELPKEDLEQIQATNEPDGIFKNFDVIDALLASKELKKGGIFALKIEEVSVFFNKLYYDYELKEMVAPLNIPEGTCKSHNYRAKQKIRKFMKNRFDLKDSIPVISN